MKYFILIFLFINQIGFAASCYSGDHCIKNDRFGNCCKCQGGSFAGQPYYALGGDLTC